MTDHFAALSARTPRQLLAALLLIAFALFAPAALAASQPVLMISIDGLKPEYVTHADEHGLKIPTLRRFLTEGTYAEGVTGVMPTVTYPSHTTLITGVPPAVHGIFNNQTFDPERKYAGAWYWYAQDIRVPTLWDAARARGMVTASVSWPVSVDAKGVEYLIPEYWRTASPAGAVNPDDRKLMAALSRPVGMLADMETRIGPYMMGNDTTVDGDAIRTRFSLEILKTKKPGFMTIHLSSLDEAEHISGPFSDEADKTLEAIDGMVAQLIAAAQANNPNTVVAIVSDHGFAPISKSVNLAIPFLEAGLVKIGKPSGLAGMMGGTIAVTEWQAEPWMAGGMAAIMLHDPSDDQVKKQVKAILDKLAGEPANGIARILTADEIRKYGGFPNAAFVIALKPGYVTGAGLGGALVTDTLGKGTHGYLTDFPEMRASFFILGSGIAQGKDLGVVDMRRIAPTIAGVLGASLPTAKEPPLPVAAK
jgi:predicted AlkP superfamily pyrophosphatase or phosphodiesterase